jgi:vitamin B12 transporter
MFKKSLLFVLAAFPLAVPILGQEKEGQTVPPILRHEIVVSATRIETPAKEIASSITVITRLDLEKSKKSTVLEFLQDVLGTAVIQNGGKGSASSTLLRGSNSEHVLIMLDGVELNDPMNPSRSYDLAHFSLDNVEQIEILRGPQSTLYGSDALGGVINILTKRGRGKPQFSLSSSGGSYNTFQAAAGLSGSGRSINYSLGLSRFVTGGISAASSAYPGNTERDGYKNLSFSGRLGATLKKNIEADIIFRSVTARTDIDSFGGPSGDDPNNAQDYRSFFIRGQFRTLLAGDRWEQKLGVSYVHSHRQNENPVDDIHPYDSENGIFKSSFTKIDWQNNLFLHPANTLTFGADIEREQGESEYHSTGIWGPYDSLFPRRKADRTGIYVQDQVRLANRFFATAGVRLDHHGRTGFALTYRLAPAYFSETTGTKFKATLGTGFKSPSLYQLYAPGTFLGPVGNERLKPEENVGWDVGIEQRFLGGRLQAGVTYFSCDYRNLIDFRFDAGYVNVGKARTRGMEIYAEARPANDLDLRAGYTRLDAKDLDSGADLLRRPKDKFSAALDCGFFKKWALHLGLVYVGKRPDKNFSVWPYPDVLLSAYTLLDAALSFDLNPQVQVFGRLDNILDQKYEFVYGYGTPRFSAYGGIRVSWQ